ncbi:uncharacterized protein METZ01_LOCUS470262, partial [marine metagenome]
AISYYKNGEIKEYKNYIFNKIYSDFAQKNFIDGEYKLNYIDGQPCIRGKYDKGSFVGDWERYHVNGQHESKYFIMLSNKETKIKTSLFNIDGTKIYSGSVSIKLIEKEGKEYRRINFSTKHCELLKSDWTKYVTNIYVQCFISYGPPLSIDAEHFHKINEFKDRDPDDVDYMDDDYREEWEKEEERKLYSISTDILDYHMYSGYRYDPKNYRFIDKNFPYPKINQKISTLTL